MPPAGVARPLVLGERTKDMPKAYPRTSNDGAVVLRATSQIDVLNLNRA